MHRILPLRWFLILIIVEFENKAFESLNKVEITLNSEHYSKSYKIKNIL